MEPGTGNEMDLVALAMIDARCYYEAIFYFQHFGYQHVGFAVNGADVFHEYAVVVSGEGGVVVVEGREPVERILPPGAEGGMAGNEAVGLRLANF